MTTFWLSFNDPDASSDKRFLGVAIFDMDESAGPAGPMSLESRRAGMCSGGRGDTR
jgi:hypothetical protein